ncbi:hypothetical protein HanRHA438_Chr08g0360671 [Helianthus annuus]|nr:hypothetical protein HanRHA438_Chr08g0360671 [Helianthus annuus]
MFTNYNGCLDSGSYLRASPTRSHHVVWWSGLAWCGLPCWRRWSESGQFA